MSMLNKPLFVVTALLASSLVISAQAETMSSDVVQSGILEPSLAIPELPTDPTSETPGAVTTQASAYFSPVGGSGQMSAKDAVVLTSGALVLGSFFLKSSSDSDSSLVPITSPGLEPGAGVAPVPELNTMSLMLVAMVGLMGAAWLRKKKEGAANAPVRVRANFQ